MILDNILIKLNDSNTGKILHVQGIRGLSIIAVLLFHIFPDQFVNGYLGVDIFFIISGYIVFKILTKQQEHNESWFIFYVKRIRRIVPAYYACIFITCLTLFLYVHPVYWKRNALNGLKSTLFISNFHEQEMLTYFNLDEKELNLFLHTWSLSVEMQFYIIAPILQSLICNNKLIFLALLSLKFHMVANETAAFYSLLSRFWQFSIGILISMNEGNLSNYFEGLSIVIDLSLFVIVCIIFGPQLPFSNHSIRIIVAVLSACLFTKTNYEDKCSIADNLLSHKFLTSLGVLSYSVYMWHWIVLKSVEYHDLEPFLRTLFTCFGTISLSLASFLIIERTTNDSKALNNKIIIFLLTITFFMNLLTCIALIFHPESDRYLRSSSNNITCKDGERFLNKTEKHFTAFTWGDSHARRVAYSINQNYNGNATYVGAHGCPPFPTSCINFVPKECSENNNRSLEIIKNSNVNTIIIAARYFLYLREHQHYFASNLRNLGKRDKERLFFNCIQKSVNYLELLNKKVVLMYPQPESKFNIPEVIMKYEFHKWAISKLHENLDIPLQVHKNYQEPVIKRLNMIYCIDCKMLHPDLIFCQQNICNVFSYYNQTVISYYTDNSHISCAGQQKLSILFKSGGI